METVQTVSAIECVVIVFNNRPRPFDTRSVEDGSLSRQVTNMTGQTQVGIRGTGIERVVCGSEIVCVHAPHQRTGSPTAKIVLVSIRAVRVFVVSKGLFG